MTWYYNLYLFYISAQESVSTDHSAEWVGTQGSFERIPRSDLACRGKVAFACFTMLIGFRGEKGR